MEDEQATVESEEEAAIVVVDEKESKTQSVEFNCRPQG
jgi:hypothetical protein